MTAREADRTIASGQPVRVVWPLYHESGIITIARRDRYNIYTADGGVYDRADTELVKPIPPIVAR